MNFKDWATQFSHKHVSDAMHQLLNELKDLEARELSTLSAELRARLAELQSFEQKVKKMLVAEWQWFLDIEANGDQYSSYQ